MKQIPYVIHEAAMQRLRDSMRRTIAALLILLAIFIVMWILK